MVGTDETDSQKALPISEMGMNYNETDFEREIQMLEKPKVDPYCTFFSLPEQTPLFSLFNKSFKKPMASKFVSSHISLWNPKPSVSPESFLLSPFWRQIFAK